ncbi:MAG: chromosomal replication initiator protein DnaA [Candidatus Melainabacteria bacterium HGW-Melainabacteria-1]|nr:MAG: chromosomal replication initiator protein DnaA [Candidatus Melainabacteria bacterium HGW-Melainabacteria-1]
MDQNKDSRTDSQSDVLWQDILKSLEIRLNNQPAFGLISTQLHLLEAEPHRLLLGVPNNFTLRKISQDYLAPLQQAVADVLGPGVAVEFDIVARPMDGAQPGREDIRQSAPAQVRTTQVQRPLTANNLNPRYTFENFVVGSHNKFAHATAWRVAETPGTSYNPLFLYGGVGLGKTHLMQAIGLQILLFRPDFRVTYISSERFTNELINAFRDGTTPDFKNRYRSVDLLLIDDIQFIGGKESTQEEFFHTFNDLHEAGKQIVMTSDRPPNELSTLENRLRSRFQMGLICDIQPPDFETRIAILKKKADMDELEIPDEVLHFVARVYKSNVRELEGALIKLMAYTSMTGTQPTVSMAQSVLGQLPERDINPGLIQELTSDQFNLTVEDLKGQSRSKTINKARQIAIYLCCELTDLSTPKIGEFFGNRDHTTILHARDKIREQMQSDPDIPNIVNKLIARLK